MQFFSLYVVYVLYRERKEKSRPYIQVSNETVRDSLACITLRNAGDCLAEIVSIGIDDVFINSNIRSKEKKESIANLKGTSIIIVPNQSWVLAFDVMIGDLQIKKLSVAIGYRKYSKRKIYRDTFKFDYESIGSFLKYQSDLDEINKTLKEIKKELK